MIDGKNPNLSVYRVIYRRNTIMKVSDVNYFYGFGDWSDHIFWRLARDKCLYPVVRVASTESAHTHLSECRIPKVLLPSCRVAKLSELRKR